MKKSINLHGIVPPMITPMTGDAIDINGTKNIVDFLIEGGVHSLFILGSMGEGPNLTLKNQRKLTEIVVEHARGRVPILLGVSDVSTDRVLNNIDNLVIDGIDMIVSTLPFYFTVTEEEKSEHFKRIADYSPVPLLLYDIPKRVYNSLSDQVVFDLVDYDNIAGLKDSSGNLRRFRYLLEQLGEDRGFLMFLGDSSMIDLTVYLGADGVIPTDAHIAPELCAQTYNLAREGKWEQAREKQKELNLLRNKVFEKYATKASHQSYVYKNYLSSKGILVTEKQ